MLIFLFYNRIILLIDLFFMFTKILALLCLYFLSFFHLVYNFCQSVFWQSTFKFSNPMKFPFIAKFYFLFCSYLFIDIIDLRI